MLEKPIKFFPKHVFIVTSLWTVSDELNNIRNELKSFYENHSYEIIDANSFVTWWDFLEKIWKTISGSPIVIAIITEDMKISTLENIFYELWIADSMWKETLIIKGAGCSIWSDMVRTQYLKYDNDFLSWLEKYLNELDERLEFYLEMAEVSEVQPTISLDYLRRAYLLSWEQKHKEMLQTVLKENIRVIDETFKRLLLPLLK